MPFFKKWGGDTGRPEVGEIAEQEMKATSIPSARNLSTPTQ
jgi:hypothetical protein